MGKNKYQYTAPEEIEVPVEEKIKIELVDFGTWYALRDTLIPPQHKKEILLADFKGRKVSLEASTMEQFDEALKKYGVELK